MKGTRKTFIVALSTVFMLLAHQEIVFAGGRCCPTSCVRQRICRQRVCCCCSCRNVSLNGSNQCQQSTVVSDVKARLVGKWRYFWGGGQNVDGEGNVTYIMPAAEEVWLYADESEDSKCVESRRSLKNACFRIVELSVDSTGQAGVVQVLTAREEDGKIVQERRSLRYEFHGKELQLEGYESHFHRDNPVIDAPPVTTPDGCPIP